MLCQSPMEQPARTSGMSAIGWGFDASRPRVCFPETAGRTSMSPFWNHLHCSAGPASTCIVRRYDKSDADG
jgi:hypothetical protein